MGEKDRSKRRWWQFWKPSPTSRQGGHAETVPAELARMADETLTDEFSVIEPFRSHLNRIRGDMRDERMTMILHELEILFLEEAFAINVMVQQTLSDQQLHTKAIGGAYATWVVVSAVPSSRHESAAFFALNYPPGYGGYMNFWLNSEVAQSMKASGRTVFAHVIVYADGSVGLGLCPLDLNNPDSCPRLVFPEESLTQEDRRLMGL